MYKIFLFKITWITEVIKMIMKILIVSTKLRRKLEKNARWDWICNRPKKVQIRSPTRFKWAYYTLLFLYIANLSFVTSSEGLRCKGLISENPKDIKGQGLNRIKTPYAKLLSRRKRLSSQRVVIGPFFFYFPEAFRANETCAFKWRSALWGSH